MRSNGKGQASGVRRVWCAYAYDTATVGLPALFAGWSSWKLGRLITSRSPVRIRPPQQPISREKSRGVEPRIGAGNGFVMAAGGRKHMATPMHASRPGRIGGVIGRGPRRCRSRRGHRGSFVRSDLQAPCVRKNQPYGRHMG